MTDYGLDKELKEKMDAKYDPALESQVVEWVETITGEKKGSQSVAEWLKSGVVLCSLANAIRPGTVKKVHANKIPAFQHENITFFVNAARGFGVPESSCFSSPDLYEEKNMGSVILCLYMLGGAVQVSCPEFTGPKLGIPITVESTDKKREGGLLTDQSAGLSATMDIARPTERADYCVRPIGTPPKQVSPRQPSPRPAASTSPRPAAASTSPSKPAAAPAADAPAAAAPAEAAASSAADGELVYGLDKELKEKAAAKYDVNLEREVIEWVEALTKSKKGDQSAADWLRNGEVLCALANAIKPGCIKKVHTSKIAAFQHENITFFVNAARSLGVPESSTFSSPDLYEEKNMGSVINCIYTLGGAIQASCPEFTGPKLGVPITVESHDKRRGSGKATDINAGFASTMEVARPTERADYVVKPIDRS